MLLRLLIMIYSVLYFVILLFLLPVELLKRPRTLRKRWLLERLGFLPCLHTTYHDRKPSSLIWIHAVSVGEVAAVTALIEKLRDRYPESEIVLSTVTDTGQELAKARIGSRTKVVYMPFDLPIIIRNALRYVRPSLFIIMETELWPNLIRILTRSDIPILLFNGRISEKSLKGYKKIKYLMRSMLRDVSLFCMQDEAYADRIKQLGAKPEKVKVLGSFKFDTKPPSTVPEWTKTLEGFKIVAGSTHRTEEALVIDVYIKLRKDFPRLNLIIAPRHPERFREVEELIIAKGLVCVKRSSFQDASTSVHPSPVVILLDVIGELSSLYGVCDLAIVGGSFINHGGQNPLEPAYWGKAIVCGPHMENFPFIDDFYRNGGAKKVNRDGLYETLKSLIGSPEEMSSMGRIAKNLYEKNTGATDRALEIIMQYL